MVQSQQEESLARTVDLGIDLIPSHGSLELNATCRARGQDDQQYRHLRHPAYCLGGRPYSCLLLVGLHYSHQIQHRIQLGPATGGSCYK